MNEFAKIIKIEKPVKDVKVFYGRVIKKEKFKERKEREKEGELKERKDEIIVSPPIDVVVKPSEEELRKAYSEGFKAGEISGYKKGLEEGKKIAQRECEKELEKIRNLIGQIRDKISEELKSAEPHLLKLAYTIAKKVIAAELRINKNAILNIVREAIERLKDKTKIIVKLNPADYDFVEKEKEKIKEGFEIKELKFERDEKVKEGGCIVQTQFEEVDAQIDMKLKEIEKQLIGNV